MTRPGGGHANVNVKIIVLSRGFMTGALTPVILLSLRLGHTDHPAEAYRRGPDRIGLVRAVIAGTSRRLTPYASDNGANPWLAFSAKLMYD